ncbi:MAG: hypothetical protein Q9186_006159 [Xanthomendoza sp. 1 TL-2023]
MRRLRRRVAREHELHVLRSGFDGADEERGEGSMPQGALQRASDSGETVSSESQRDSPRGSTPYLRLSSDSEGSEGSGMESSGIEVRSSDETQRAADGSVGLNEGNGDGEDSPAAAQVMQEQQAPSIQAPRPGKSPSLSEYNNQRRIHEWERSSAD